MDHDYLAKLKQTHATLRLLAADNAPLIIGFVHQVFIQPNQRSVAESELTSRLEDYLFHLRGIHGQSRYPRAARQYLEDWSGGETAFLRKYYTDLSDDPEFDLTPATEKAVEWLQSLEERQFVGTESRLLTVFQLLREIAHNTEQDPQARIAELERQRAAIDAEIEKVLAGQHQPYDPTRVKERFYQVEDTARRLLGDFRQVEHNFRALDRATRERIATSDLAKGDLLDQIFAEHDVIWDSDQGRSFRAFWEFLMSPSRQEELQALLHAVLELPEIRELDSGPFLQSIKFYLMEAGEKVYRTNNLLVEQLRKFLDDQAHLENKRILEIIKTIERRAIAIKDQSPGERDFASVADPKPELDLVMTRGLFSPPRGPLIEALEILEGEAEVDVDALYQQTYVDEQVLRANIRLALQRRPQISLSQLAGRFPIRKGLAELVGYLRIASAESGALIDPVNVETIRFGNTEGRPRQVRLPQIIFTRRSERARKSEEP